MRSRGHRIHAAGQALIFEIVGAARDADIEPAARDDVGHRGFTGELQRMPERSDDRAGAEADIRGPPRQAGNVDEGIGRDGEIHAVMLSGPHGVESAGIGHLAELDEFAVELGMALRRVKPFHVDKKREFHVRSPPSLRPARDRRNRY